MCIRDRFTAEQPGALSVTVNWCSPDSKADRWTVSLPSWPMDADRVSPASQTGTAVTSTPAAAKAA